MSFASFGQLNIDLIYSGLNRLPDPGEELCYPDFDIQLGGGSALIPIVLNHFGIKSKLGTFLSEDFLSTVAGSLLQRMGLREYYNFYSKKDRSPIFITSAVSLPKDRCFISYCDDRTEFIPSEDKVYEFLHGSEVCFGVTEYPDVMKRLREKGTKVIYDLGWQQENFTISRYAEILRNVDIYTPNDKEAMHLTNTRSAEEALWNLSEYVDIPIVKIGSKGSLTIENGQTIYVGMPCKFDAVDTTGAGDNFLTGIAYGLCKNWNIIDCIRMGNVFGGVSTTKLGCFKGIMSLAENDILNYMKMYKG